MVIGLVACATGGKFNGAGGSSSDGGSGASGGGGSGGSTTTTTTTTGGSTTTTTTSTSSSMPTCDESPCQLVSPQCGCDAGDMCAINGDGDRECHAEGTTQIHQPCTGLYSCVAGSLCIGTATKSMCSSYCDQDSQCAGGLCLIQLNDPGSPGNILAGVTLCSDDCDPTTAAGCPSGFGCQLGQEQTGQMRTFTVCQGAGANGQGAACTSSDQCAAGSACFTLSDNSMQCLKYCKVASPSCPGAATCYSFDPPIIHEGTEFGACL